MLALHLKKARLLSFSGLLTILVVLAFTAPAQATDLIVDIRDTTGTAGEIGSAVSIYMDNFNQEIAAYTLWIVLSNPHILKFNTVLDTLEYEHFYSYTEFDPLNPDSAIDSVEASLYWVCQDWEGQTCTDSIQMLGYYHCNNYAIPGDITSCTDSTFIDGYDVFYLEERAAYRGTFDTAGTLTSGWERVETRSVGVAGTEGFNMVISALANEAAPPYTPGIPIQSGSDTPLIRIKGDVFDIAPDDTNRTVNITIALGTLDYFGFSDEAGNSIGIVTDTVIDTFYYECYDWVPPVPPLTDSTCGWWERVQEEPEGGADSMRIVYKPVGHLDTNLVKVYSGIFTVLAGVCGDVSGPQSGVPDDNVNILDIIFLVNYKFKGGAAPIYLAMGDTNCDISVNILDIVRMVNFKFKNGPDLICCPALWP